MFNFVEKDSFGTGNNYKKSSYKYNKKIIGVFMFKKLFLLCSCCVFGIIFAYTQTPNVEFIPVMAVPVSNKVIVVDGGHGTPDERSYQ